MAKFKNKKTGEVVEENLLYYVDFLKKNPNFKEVKEKIPKTLIEETKKTDEVEDKPLR